MNILVFNWQDIKNPNGGGAEVHFHEIFKRIVSMGHKVTLCCCEIEGEPKKEVIDGIQIIRHGSRNLFNYYVPSLYKKLTKSNNYDLIIDDINKIPFFTPLFVNKPLIALSHHFFGKSIYKEAGFISGTYVYLSELLIPIIYKNIPIVVVSESTKQEFLDKGFDESKIDIVYNAISQSQFPMKVGIKNSYPTITYFGRLKKYKSVDDLLKAFSVVRNKFPKAKLEIIGRGDYMENLKQLANNLKINNDITFHGFVDDTQKIELLSRSHLVVNTSMKEGWGITNIEANACGTPIISADSPGLRDSVHNGFSGLLYEWNNVDDLVKQIIYLLEDEERLNQYSLNSIEWSKKFDWDISAKKMIDIFEKKLETTKSI